MLTIIIGILVIALIAGLALFIFKNAAKIVALVLVAFIGYVGWHLYIADKGITPKSVTESVSKKGENVFNKALDSVMGSVSSASESVKEKASEATEKAIDTTKEKAKEVTTKAKKKAKDKANEVLN